MTDNRFPNARTLFETIGREKLCAHLGVSLSSLRNYEAGGLIPAAWYGPIRELLGEDPPDELFRWKSSGRGSDNDNGAAA